MKHRGIKRKTAVTVTILVILSLSLLGLAMSVLIFLNEKSRILDLQREVVKYAVNEMSWDIHELEGKLDIISSRDDLIAQDRKKQHNALSQMLTEKDTRSHDILEELVLLDNKGKELSRVSREKVFVDKDLRDRSKSNEFMIPAESGEIYYSPISYDEVTFEPRVTMSIPVIDLKNNKTKGVLVGRVRLNRIWENAVTRSFGNKGIIFITNREGRVVAHPDPSVIYRNTFFNAESPEGIQTGLNNKRAMLASGNFKLGDQAFIVFASLPFSEVMALSMKSLSITAAFIPVFILLSIVLSYLAANRIVRPIEKLADSANSISQGDMASTIDVGDTDEIGDLSRALNNMTSRLIDTITSLEKEVAERKRAEEMSHQQYTLLNNIINSLTHPFYVIDANNYSIKLANTAAGFGDLSGEPTCYNLTHFSDVPCSSEHHPCVIQKIKETKKPAMVEHIHYDKNGKTIIAEVHGYPIFDDKGDIAQVIEYNLDISDRKKAEEQVRKFKILSDNSNDVHFLVGKDGKFLYVNKAACTVSGYSEEELLSMSITDIDTVHDLPKFQELLDQIQKEKIPPIESINRRKDGSLFPVEITVTGHEIGGRPYMFAALRDISERKAAEEKINTSLKEKEILLREIHHRVKNNMQIISSLLNLQSMLLSNKKDIDMLKDSQNRIKAMSLIHEKLYRSEDLANIDIKDYITDLTRNIMQFFQAATSNVTLDINVEKIWLGIDTAIPCGLIINELTSNSLKYAFPEGGKGVISIILEKAGEDKIVLDVSDNGVGIPEDIDFRNTKTLGLQLVTTLSENQLKGTLELDRSNGTRFRITFEEVKYKQRF